MDISTALKPAVQTAIGAARVAVRSLGGLTPCRETN